MIQDLEIYDTVRRINEILKTLGVSYHFTGGLAVSYYGEPRLTRDGRAV